MPVRSLNTAVLRWPDRELVIDEARHWAQQMGRANRAIERILCYGSAITGGWGVGSDLDVVIVVRETAVSFNRRSAEYSVEGISVPVDCIVYTEDEYASLRDEDRRISGELDRRSLVLYEKE